MITEVALAKKVKRDLPHLRLETIEKCILTMFDMVIWILENDRSIVLDGLCTFRVKRNLYKRPYIKFLYNDKGIILGTHPIKVDAKQLIPATWITITQSSVLKRKLNPHVYNGPARKYRTV